MKENVLGTVRVFCKIFSSLIFLFLISDLDEFIRSANEGALLGDKQSQLDCFGFG